MESIKCVVCGDAAVGKSALCVAFTTSAFVAEYTPTLYDQFVANVMVDGKPSRLVLYDTSGDEDYDPLRSLCFPGARVFLLAFSVASRASLEAVRRKWASEVRQHDPRVPLVLVGTQADLRDDPAHKRKLVQPEEVAALATEIGAYTYVECSALNQSNQLKQVFDDAVRSARDAASSHSRRPSAISSTRLGAYRSACWRLLCRRAS